MSRLVILEGTCGAGKTTLLDSLPAAFPGRSLHLVSQKRTYGPLVAYEDSHTLTNELNRSILLALTDELRRALDEPDRLVVADTLHLTQYVRARALDRPTLLAVDQALASVASLVVVLQIDRSAIRARTIEARRHSAFSRYIQKFGADDDALVEHFHAEQQTMIDFVRHQSRIPAVLLDGGAPRDLLRRQFVATVEALGALG